MRITRQSWEMPRLPWRTKWRGSTTCASWAGAVEVRGGGSSSHLLPLDVELGIFYHFYPPGIVLKCDSGPFQERGMSWVGFPCFLPARFPRRCGFLSGEITLKKNIKSHPGSDISALVAAPANLGSTILPVVRFKWQIFNLKWEFSACGHLGAPQHSAKSLRAKSTKNSHTDLKIPQVPDLLKALFPTFFFLKMQQCC